MTSTINIKEDDTDHLELTISTLGLENLDDLASAVLYARRRGATSNEVDGAALAVADSAAKLLRFDPVGSGPNDGDAFTEPGVYQCYVLATWTDGRQTRHPGSGTLTANVTAGFEG